MDEVYKCSSSLDSSWAQLWSWITIPSGLAYSGEPELPSESLWLILHSCVPSFLSWPYSHFPTTFPWEYLLINHVDTKSHLRICFWESKLRDYSNFYPIILQQCTPFIFFPAGVKSCYYRLGFLVHLFIDCITMDCEQIEGRDCIFN